MIEERIEKLQSDLGKVQAELDELKAQIKQPEDRFVPKVGERYWLVDSIGDYRSEKWRDGHYDHYRLATGNCFRTQAEARRHKASLFVKTPTGPCPKVGSRIYYWNLSRNDLGLAEAGSITAKGAVGMWGLGECCLAGFEKELEAKWRKYGWSVTGEPEPEGWES
jgi:hypothetical protein